jgi:hypothetical protein
MGVQSQPQYTTLTDLVTDIQEIVKAYRSDVLESIEKSIDDCGDIFIKEAQKVSPVDTGEYKASWAKKKLRKAKYVVYVGNTKKVRRNKKDPGRSIPLINILEFGTGWRRRPHVGTALNNSKDQIINTITSGITGVK